MRTLKRLTVWLVETSFEALLLGAVLIALFGYDKNAFGKDLLIYSLSISFMFFTTGYLVTTVILRALWKGRSLWWYPAIATTLFFIHFEIMNVGMGGAFGQRDRYRTLAAGLCIAFACTLLGTFALKRWATPHSDMNAASVTK